MEGTQSEHEQEREMNGQDARWPHRQNACATLSHESCFAPGDFCRDLVGARFDYELSRCDIIVVLLVAANLDGIETSVWRSGGIQLEDCADGSGGVAEIA